MTATWAGGVDGGAFIECRDTGTPGLLICTVYNDTSGDLWDEGHYRNETNVATVDLPAQYSGFDGHRILLALPEGGGRYPTLVASDSTGRPLTEAEVNDRQLQLLPGA